MNGQQISHSLARILVLTYDFEQGRDGIVIVKTTQAILVAHYNENQIAGNSATTVESLADYLVKLGY